MAPKGPGPRYGHASPDDDGPPSSSFSGQPPWYIQAGAGGNDLCHCVHVEKLIADMEEVKKRPGPRAQGWSESSAEDPWHRAPSSDRPSRDDAGGSPEHGFSEGVRDWPLPLKLGPLGALTSGKAIFDDRMAAQEDYRFNGTKGTSGDAWKGKIERYMISKVPALKTVLLWAETCDLKGLQEIGDELWRRAIGAGVTAEQRDTLNASIWGVLSCCLSGEAESIFKGAEMLHGIDAWRRIIRYIDHGRAIRLEQLRTEVKMLHTKPIRNLEGVAVGVAEFENKLKEYADAGGGKLRDGDKKSDLLAILPPELQEPLLWKATDPDATYEKFRDMVQSQTAKLLMHGRRLPVHAVRSDMADERDSGTFSSGSWGPGPRDGGDNEDAEDIIAVLRRMIQGNRGPRSAGAPGSRSAPPRRDDRPAPPRRDGDRPARKCPNCGGEHPMSQCTQPRVDPSERKCWGCGGKGHNFANCKTVRSGRAP